MRKNEVLEQINQFLKQDRSYNVKKTNKSLTIKEEIEMNKKEQAPHKPTVEYLKTFMHENFATKEDIKNINNRIDALESEVKDIKTSTNLIIDILTRNGMK